MSMNILNYNILDAMKNNEGIPLLYKCLDYFENEDILVSIEIAHICEEFALRWNGMFQYDLGILFLMHKNYRKGLEWLLVASKSGYLEANKLIEEVYGIAESVVESKHQKLLSACKKIKRNKDFVEIFQKIHHTII